MNPRLQALIDGVNPEAIELKVEEVPGPQEPQGAGTDSRRNSPTPPDEPPFGRVFHPEPAPPFPWSRLQGETPK
jgi:hypothetical protein